MCQFQISRRYAEFSGGCLSVLEGGSPDENISRLLADLQQEVEHLIIKLTSGFSGRKMQLIFLINNYDMILSIISVSCWSKNVNFVYQILIARSHQLSRESVKFAHSQRITCFWQILHWYRRNSLLIALRLLCSELLEHWTTRKGWVIKKFKLYYNAFLL